MADTLRVSFARLCRDTRLLLDVPQRELAAAVGVSRAHVAAVESGRVNPSLDLVMRVGEALGLELELVWRAPIALGPPSQSDAMHARCSGYVGRRLRASGWDVRREVPLRDRRWHGWIDLLAFDPMTGTLLIVEVKTSVIDLGATERQVGWYEARARHVARSLGWSPRRVITWLLVLATDDVDAFIRRNRDALQDGFPVRAVAMRAIARRVLAVDGHDGRGLALIDPSSRRRAWLIPTRPDGRRSTAPYRDSSDALRRSVGQP